MKTVVLHHTCGQEGGDDDIEQAHYWGKVHYNNKYYIVVQGQIKEVYVEFEVPKNSLIQGGKENWYKIVSPTASRSQKYQVEKQGGEIPPKYRNLTPPILTK